MLGRCPCPDPPVVPLDAARCDYQAHSGTVKRLRHMQADEGFGQARRVPHVEPDAIVAHEIDRPSLGGDVGADFHQSVFTRAEELQRIAE